jgi:hypothetical protein
MRRNMEEVYVMGHRLIAFFQYALPQHPEYSNSSSSHRDIIAWRERSRRDLAWIQNRLVVVALRVDEEELNRHVCQDLNRNQSSNTGVMPFEILQDLNNFADSDEFVRPNATTHQSPWEHFSGWSPDVTSGDMSWEVTNSGIFEDTERKTFQIIDGDSKPLFSNESNDAHPIYDTESLETSDFSFWFIEEEADESDAENIYKNESNHRVVTPSPSKSPQKVFAKLVSGALLRHRSRRDPPGMYFSKINCFSSSKSQIHRNHQGKKWNQRERNEGETISTAPSDEDY